MPSLIFCGSFRDYSVKVLEALVRAKDFEVVAVVTTPAGPTGRKGQLEAGPVEEFARKKGLTVLTPAKLSAKSLVSLPAADYLITAGYGKLLPESWLKHPRLAALNVHFSLLPKYRGANPAEWALLAGEKTTGITLIEMAEKFDTGGIIASQVLKIDQTDTRESLYQKLYRLAADSIEPMLSADFELRTRGASRSTQEKLGALGIDFYHPPKVQGQSPTPFARRLSRADGEISSLALKLALAGESLSGAKQKLGQKDFSSVLWQHFENFAKSSDLPLASFIDTAIRALKGYPGLYCMVKTPKGPKRLKLHQAKVSGKKLVLTKVALEGQTPATFNQIKNSFTLE